MKVVTIIQARTTSSRLPNKALLDVYGKSLLERVIDQAKKIRNTDELWVATSTHENDDLIELMCERLDVSCYRGDLLDVRSRFYNIAIKQKADIIVRITADNPLTEPQYANELISFLVKRRTDFDYTVMDKSKVLIGTSSEVFSIGALKKSIECYDDDYNKEHVTPAIIENMRCYEHTPETRDLISEKTYFISVDSFSDLKRVTFLYYRFGEKNTLKELIKELHNNERLS